jgi:hypothetical protein
MSLAALAMAPPASARVASHLAHFNVHWTTSAGGTELHVSGKLSSAEGRCERSRRIAVVRRSGGRPELLQSARTGPHGAIGDVAVNGYWDSSSGTPVSGTYMVVAGRSEFRSRSGGSHVTHVCRRASSAGHQVSPATAGTQPESSAYASGGPIHPGVVTSTDGAECTANFVFADASDTYIGQAAHCSGTGTVTETDGCQSDSLPIGTPVDIDGASQPGTLVYNSWLTMKERGEKDADTCAFNDLALVEIDPADVAKVDPTVPGFGGPTGVGSAEPGQSAYSYGNSQLRFGVSKLSPKGGFVVESEGGGWSRTIFTLTPGVPGDSGSGVLNSSGQAAGIISTINVAPFAGTNGVGDLPKELAYMRANSSFSGVELVSGNRPFDPNILAAILGS